MKSSVEQLDPTRVKISVEVPYAELKPSVDEAYKTIAGQVTVPGFRQGKIPARIIDQRIGRPTVIQEAINNGLDAFYRDAVEANDLKPLGQPEVEISEVPGLDGTEDGDSGSASITISSPVSLIDCTHTSTGYYCQGCVDG